MSVVEDSFLREIELEEIPPVLPPPPEEPVPITTSDTQNVAIDMIGPSSGPSLEFKINPKIAFAQDTLLEKPEFEMDFSESFSQLTNSENVFDVENLDAAPIVIKSKNTRIPRSLRKKGIQRVETRVQVIIDTSGKAYIQKIIDPKYEVMRSVIRDHVSSIRFSTPTKYGQPVTASYLFLLNFNDFSQ